MYALRDAFIPARKAELIDLLCAEAPEGSRAQVRKLGQILSALLHHEAHGQIEALKRLYDPLDPDAPEARRDATPGAFDRFESAIEEILQRANFQEIETGDVRARDATRVLTGLNVKTDLAGIRRVRYFARGARPQTVERKSLLGLRKQTVDANIFNDVVVLVGFKADNEIERRDRKAFSKMRRGVRPGAAIVKHFRNVALAELVTLHPGAKPSMQNKDRLFLGVPAIAGGVPVLANLWPALTVLFAVVATYFGARGVIEESDLKRAIAAMSGLVALITFLMRQRMKLETQTLRYQKQLADTVYFRNLANNAGVVDLLVGAGEEQDFKEAMLAYAILHKAGAPMNEQDIDKAAETFLHEKLNFDVDFEAHDALAKLVRMELATQTGDLYAARPPEECFARLDAVWDNLFSAEASY